MAAPASTAHAGPGPAPSAPSAPRSRRGPRGKKLKWIIGAVILVVAAFFGIRYWHEASLYESTDDAYVGANQVEVTAQITGTVVKVYVRDQEHVKAGDRLFDIDPANYELAVRKAQAALELARQQAQQLDAGVASAEAALAQRRAEEINARNTWLRNQQLMKSGFLSPQGAETSRTALVTAEAATRAAEAGVAQAKSALGAPGDANANVQAAVAALKQAQLDLQRTKVAAQADGQIANFNLQPGNVVQPGAPLFVIVADHEFWVDANFKETQLNAIRPGQHATVTTDMYRDHPFEGVVQSVAGGAGSAFSLLPPQNATGNWVKVTQRVPVRVRIENPDPQHPLRIGTSATVKVRKE
ncbi:MAG TPA: HlyD family secretion protein [Usitatibacter sp.]|jgi:membrane fusion protein (multidrug efflux system)|nr:HlyD family secretion protein [Usitatibacter sp.]